MLKDTTKTTITRAQEGDMQAISSIYERYHQGIFRYLFYRVGDHATAEDLTSEVFVKVLRALPDYKVRQTPFQAWLFQIARYLSIDYFRKTNRSYEVELMDTLVESENHLDIEIDHRLTSQSLKKALNQLPHDQKEVLILRFIVGMPIVEVSQALHKSIDSVKGLQRRGLLSLKELFVQQEISYE